MDGACLSLARHALFPKRALTLAFLSMPQNFVAFDEFCIRVCKDGPNAPALCQHIYDVMGCDWNMPGNYAPGSFDSCKGDTGEVRTLPPHLILIAAKNRLIVCAQPMGVYGTSTWFQGQNPTPSAHPAPATSSCVPTSTIGNGLAVSTTSSGASVSASGSTGSKFGSSAVRIRPTRRHRIYNLQLHRSRTVSSFFRPPLRPALAPDQLRARGHPRLAALATARRPSLAGESQSS